MYLPRIILCPEPTVADPAHVILWMAGSVKNGGTKYQRFLVKLLTRSIKRSLSARVREDVYDPDYHRPIGI